VLKRCDHIDSGGDARARALQPGRQGPRILLQDATERSLIDW
jgi:hypothetical protein